MAKPGDLIYAEFTTQAPSTGAATNADSTPVGTVNRMGTDDGAVTVTVTNIDTGRYKAAFTIPSGYASADSVALSIAATVGGVTGKMVIWSALLSIPVELTSTLPTSPAANTVGEALYYGSQKFGRRNTAQGGTSSTITLDAGASASDDAYKQHFVKIASGTGAGQFATITAYNGTTKVATISRPVAGGGWTTTPDNTSVFWIEPVPAVGLLASQSFNNAGQTTKLGATVATGDGADASTLLSRLTAARAGYLDNLSAGPVATAASILNIQNNTFVSSNIPVTLERPDSGSESVRITVLYADETGSPADIDASATPTLALFDNAGTDLSSRVAAWAHPSTGKYTTTYTNSASDTLENVHWELTGTVNGKVRRYVVTTQLVDTTAVDFTSGDRTTLNAIAAKAANLPADPASEAAATSNKSAVLTAVGTPAQAGSTVTLAASQPNYAPAKAGDSMGLTTAERNAVADALLDRTDGVEASLTVRQCWRIAFAILAGLGGGGNPFRNLANTKNRVTYTLDGNGQRTAITFDLT